MNRFHIKMTEQIVTFYHIFSVASREIQFKTPALQKICKRIESNLRLALTAHETKTKNIQSHSNAERLSASRLKIKHFLQSKLVFLQLLFLQLRF